MNSTPQIEAIKAALDNFVDAFNTSLQPSQSNLAAREKQLLLVILTLTNKVMSHCAAAENLHWNDYSSESLIILRSAFEAVVTINFLVIHPEEIDKYVNHSELVTYKDALLWEAHGLIDSDEELEKLHKGEIQKYRKTVIETEIHKSYGITDRTLDDFQTVAQKVRGTFCGIDKMAKSLKERDPERYSAEVWSTSRYIYNIGSQHTHPVWSRAKDFFYPGLESPVGFYSVTMPIRHIIFIFLWLTFAWENADFLPKEKAGYLKRLLVEVTEEVKKLDSSEP